MRKAIVNGRIVLGERVLTGHALVFGERIEQICPQATLRQQSIDQFLDAADLLVSPGLIDTHIHGLAGCDLMDGKLESLRAISLALASHGITSFLPTSMSRPLPEIEAALETVRQAMTDGQLPGARVLGVHLEGPFLSEQYAGAQDKSHFLPPDAAFIRRHQDVIRLVTYAPELDPSGRFLEELLARQLIPSIGHTAADYSATKTAIGQGLCHATHLFNAMPPLHHRQPGPLGAILESAIYAELIADNRHLHPSTYRLLLSSLGLRRLILVSDCMRAADLADGWHDLGGQAVLVADGEARLRNGKLAGSVTTLEQAVRNWQGATGLSPAAALLPATENPAALLKTAAAGSFLVGNFADIACFDQTMRAQWTIVQGEIVFCRD